MTGNGTANEGAQGAGSGASETLGTAGTVESAETVEAVMRASSMAAVFPAEALGPAVEFVSAVLGVAPTFVDGERWAQFDLNGARLALAAGAEAEGAPGMMANVADVVSVAGRLAAAGWDVKGPVTGAHEVRATVTGPDGWSVVVYEPR